MDHNYCLITVVLIYILRCTQWSPCRTEISSGQSEKGTTFPPIRGHDLCFFTAADFPPPVSFLGGRLLHPMIHSTRRFVSREVAVGPKYRKWSKTSENGKESIRQFKYFSGGLSGESWKQIRMSNCWKNVWQMKTRRTRCLFCFSLKDEWKMLCYPRFFSTKTTRKTWKTRTQKSDSGGRIAKTIF